MPKVANEGQHHAPHTRIDMTEDLSTLSQGGDLLDGIDDTLGILGRRSDEQDGAPRDRFSHRLEVNTIVLANRDVDRLHTKIMRRLLEGRVGANG